MIKELKYLFFIFIISLVLLTTLKHYFSSENKMKSYRSFNEIEKKITTASQSLILLTSDTNNTVKYVEKDLNQNKKNYNFWKLINIDE